jgi:hypothetical protein
MLASATRSKYQRQRFITRALLPGSRGVEITGCLALEARPVSD